MSDAPQLRGSDALRHVTLRVVLDLRNPFSYLALRPCVELVRERDLDADWLPIDAAPLKRPAPPGPDDDRGTRHRRYRSEALVREIAVYAEAAGLVIRDEYRDGDVAAANAGWLYVRAHHPEALADYLEAAFRGYWDLSLDASSLDDVADRVSAVGGDAVSFHAWAQREGPGAAASVEAALRERGVQQAPTYLVEDEVFLGRQHLPMIAWILDGRSGRGPI